MKKIALILILTLMVACSQPADLQPEINPTAVPQATEPLPTQTPVPPTVTAEPPTPTAELVSEPTLAPTSVPTADPDAPKFEFASHYGGAPAGRWDKSNWENFLANHPELDNTKYLPTDYYRSFINRTIYSQLESENPPDVYHAALGGHLYKYAEQGIIADISDLWDEQGWDDVFPASIKSMASVNGRQYFVPQAIQWNGIFYRTDVMDAAGVEPPQTWDELLAACDSLREAGYIPFAMTAQTSWPPPMGFWFTHINQRLNGPEFHERLMDGEISYTDPRVRAVFEHYQQLFEHNCFDENARRNSYTNAVTIFNSGEAAMYAHGEWLYEFISEGTKQVTDFIRFPIIDESIPLGELVPMYGAFMLADTDFPEAARDFLIFAASEESQATFLADIKRLPSNLNVDRSSLLPMYENGLQAVKAGKTLTQLVGANTDPQVASLLLEGIGRFWEDPESIDQWLENIEGIRQKVYGEIAPTSSVVLNFSQAQSDPVIVRQPSISSRMDPGAMIYHEGQFHMFINRFDSFPAAVEVGYATSADGRTWTEAEIEPLLTTEFVPFAEVAVVASDVLVEEDGTWVLYFHTWQTWNLANGKGVIGRATASVPTGPWQVDPNPILSMADSADEWDGGQVSIADVVKVDGEYRMYYTGASRSGLMQVGLATSPDGLNWTKYDDPDTTEAPYAQSDPVIRNGERGQWDANAVFTARVLPTSEGWMMLYKNIGTRTEGAKMGLAASIDGINWEKSADSPIFDSKIVDGGRAFGLTALVSTDDQLYLFTEHYTDSISVTDIFLLIADAP